MIERIRLTSIVPKNDDLNKENAEAQRPTN